MSYYDDVLHFCKKFELPYNGDGRVPQWLDPGLLAKRNEHVAEELEEFRLACDNGDLPAAADAIVDAIYVLLGTAHMMALPINEIWYAVHCANMNKVLQDGGAAHKLGINKPPGWHPPDVAAILARVKKERNDALAHEHRTTRTPRKSAP